MAVGGLHSARIRGVQMVKVYFGSCAKEPYKPLAGLVFTGLNKSSTLRLQKSLIELTPLLQSHHFLFKDM